MSGYERIRLSRMLEKMQTYGEYAERLGLADSSSYADAISKEDRFPARELHEKTPLI